MRIPADLAAQLDDISAVFTYRRVAPAECAPNVTWRVEIEPNPRNARTYTFTPPQAGAPMSALDDGAVTDEQARESLFDLCQHFSAHEVAILRIRLKAGMIDGKDWDYCIIGSVAAMRGQTYSDMPNTIAPANAWHEIRYTSYGTYTDLLRPIEVWLFGVGLRNTPANNAAAAKLDAWLAEWLELHTLTSSAAPYTALLQ